MLENTPRLEAKYKMKLFFAYRPWEDEPDVAEWVDEGTEHPTSNETGYTCRIERNPITGTLCGYVGVPKGDKFFGVGDEDIALDTDEDETTQAELRQIAGNVHGGITYSGMQNGLWFFGFDTAHHNDFLPALVEKRIEQGDVGEDMKYYDCTNYRTWEYVENEIHWLAWRLKKYNDYDEDDEQEET
jgi:hypothetical protein